MNKYLVKIFTKHLQTKFEIESDKEINDANELNPHIIDFLGKSDIKWEYIGAKVFASDKYRITYEEVTNGSGQHGIVREETETRV